MPNEIEIEYKSGITEQVYLSLIKKYASSAKSWTQINDYFDTKDLEFYKDHTTIRFRTISNKVNLEIKTKRKINMSEETHQSIPQREVQDAYQNGFILMGKHVYYCCRLITERTELLINSYVVCFDKSIYEDGSTDYEIEIECPNEKDGKTFFENFLKENNITYQEMIGKRHRCFLKKGLLESNEL